MKRPMVLIGLALVFGEILGFIGGAFAYACIGLCICIAVILGAKKKQHKAAALCFLLAPVFVAAGYLNIRSEAASAKWLWSHIPEGSVVLEGSVVSVQKKAVRTYIFIDHVFTDSGVRYPKNMQLVIDAKTAPELYAGDRLSVLGRIELFEAAVNPGMYDARESYREKGVYYKAEPEAIRVVAYSPYKFRRMLQLFIEKLFNVYKEALGSIYGGELCALVFGDTSSMDSRLKALYASQGAAHLFSVSGLHMGLAGLGLRRLLKRAGLPDKGSAVICTAFMLAYGWMCGFGNPAVRAGLMLILLMAADCIGRSYDSLSALFFAAVWILFKEPLALKSFGFLMSFGTVASLTTVLPLIMKCLPKWIRPLAPGVSISLAAVPLTAWFQYEIPAYSILLNIVLLPAIGLLFPLAIAGGLAGCLFPAAGRFLLGGCAAILWGMEQLCRFFAGLPYSALITGRPYIWTVVLCYAALIGSCILIKKCGSRLPLLSFVLYAALFIRVTDMRFKAVFLDVGQGDCTLLLLPEGQSALIDGGSSSVTDVGRYRIQKALKYYGIRKLDMIILTHMDEDHVNGAEALLSMKFPVGQLLLPAFYENEEKIKSFQEKAGTLHIPVSFIGRGTEIKIGGLSMRCLWPASKKEGMSDNALSIVLEAVYQTVRFLFTGDLEGEGEAAILPYVNSADILKVAHHGSKNSTSAELLKACRPKAAVISCGVRNRYGHPHQALLDRLSAAGAVIYTTPAAGAIFAVCDGENWWIETPFCDTMINRALEE